MWTLPVVASWLPSSTQNWSLTLDSPWSTQSAPAVTSELPFPSAFMALAYFPLAFFPMHISAVGMLPIGILPTGILAVSMLPSGIPPWILLLLTCYPLAFSPFFQLSNLAAGCSSRNLCTVTPPSTVLGLSCMQGLAAANRQAEIMTPNLALHVT